MKYRILSSFLVALSGLLFVSDHIVDFFNIKFKNIYGFNSDANYAFFVGTWIGTLLIIFSTRLKPYFISYLVPVYNILLSLYWLYFTVKYDDQNFLNIYILVSSILLLIIFAFISVKAKKAFENEAALQKKSELLESVLDLTVLANEKFLKKNKEVDE